MPAQAEQEQTEQQDAGGGGQEEVQRALMRLDLDPHDVEALGLRVSTQAAHLELNAIPEDGQILGKLLVKAADMLERLGSGSDEEEGGQEGQSEDGEASLLDRAGDKVTELWEKLRQWITAQLVRLVKWLLSKLVSLAADRFSQKLQASASKAGGQAKQGGQKAGSGAA